MYVQVVTFNLNGMTEAELQKMGGEVFLPALIGVPGLLSKIWLSDSHANIYGGVYTWQDRQSMEDYARSDFFRAFASDPHFANMKVQTFDLLEAPSRVTNGLPAPVPAAQAAR